MASEKPTFPIRLDFYRPPKANLDVGAPFSLAVAIETASTANLSGAAFRLVDDAGVIVTEGVLPPLARVDPQSDEYDPRHGRVDLRDFAEIALTAPDTIATFARRSHVGLCLHNRSSSGESYGLGYASAGGHRRSFPGEGGC
jgi:hypothetical protein